MITTQTLNKIKTHAHSSGACDLIRDVQSEAELFDLIFSAQGREWIKGASEPTLRALTRLLEEASDTRYIQLDKLSAPVDTSPALQSYASWAKAPCALRYVSIWASATPRLSYYSGRRSIYT